MDAQLSFLVPEDFREELQKIADDAGMKLSDVCRLGLKLAVPELRKRFGNLQTPDQPETSKRKTSAAKA